MLKKYLTPGVITLVVFLLFFLIGFNLAGPEVEKSEKIKTEALYHQISVEQAKQLVANRDRHMEAGTLIEPEGERFNMNEVELLTELNEAEYLYIEKGAHNDGTECSVLWALTKDNEKIASLILERSTPCPPLCPNEMKIVYNN